MQDAPMSESWSRHMSAVTGSGKRMVVSHHKWVQTSTNTRIHCEETIDVQPDSPVGKMLTVYGVTKVEMHFEDGTSEWWQHV
jgi:hypothetical protein